MNYAKALYHRFIPARIRNPIGLFRRDLADRVYRAFSSVPRRPREFLANIQLTPRARDKRSAESIIRHLELAGVSRNSPAKILDFGCGSGRIRRYFRGTAWELHGCDIDREAITPPLPYPDAAFDLVISVAVFTHFSPDQQRTWCGEIARVLKPGGLLVLSTMGPSVLGNFPHFATEASRTRLINDGSLFFHKSGSVSASAAFHTPRAIVEIFGEHFFLMRWLERGLDGFQDLSLLRRG